MKLLLIYFSLINVLVLSNIEAAVHRQGVLAEVQKVVKMSYEARRTPVVIFDLDDTLINTRLRTIKVLNAFVVSDGIRDQFLEETNLVKSLVESNIKYNLSETLQNLGIKNDGFINLAKDYWAKHFFSDRNYAQDIPMLDAVNYLRQLSRGGAKIIYLTGRNIKEAQAGTVANLIQLGFPLDFDRSILIMKSEKQYDDTQFKKNAFAEIALLGEVVAVFENEPANINAMKDYFPTSIAVFVDSIHSSKPDTPIDSVYWIENFVQEPDLPVVTQSSGSSFPSDFFPKLCKMTAGKGYQHLTVGVNATTLCEDAALVLNKDKGYDYKTELHLRITGQSTYNVYMNYRFTDRNGKPVSGKGYEYWAPGDSEFNIIK